LNIGLRALALGLSAAVTAGAHGRAQLSHGAQSNLEGAIWLYNRSLPASGRP
jgi:hypothetical protein